MTLTDQLTVGSNVTEALLSRRNTWTNQVATHARMIPERTAFRFQNRSLSWRDLHARSERFADALSRRGVGPGDRVILLVLNRPEFMEAVLAVNSLGAIAVPINFRLTAPEVAFLMADSGATAVIVDAPLAPIVDAARTGGAVADVVVTIGGESTAQGLAYEDLIAEDGDRLTRPDVNGETPALIMYTSGTTGRPKGAVLTHSNLEAQTMTVVRTFGLTGDDSIWFCGTPMFHIAAIGAICANVMVGLTTVIHPVGAFDPGALLDVLEAEEVTHIFLVPAQWQAVCAAQQERPRDLALRNISWGAAPATDSTLRAMEETFPDVDIVAVFGQTEMSAITCMLEGTDSLGKLGSVGRVVPAVQARIVDDEMNDVPVGEVGEIVYRGATMLSEYWNNPEATSDAFYGGWFHSGDLVRADDEGFIYVVDRKKDMIITGGENVYCAEIENVLASHQSIAEVAVIGKADPRWGEIPVAVVAMRPGADDLTLDALRPYLEEHLARYKHPKELVIVDALPRNARGKVVKGELRALN